MGEVLNENRRNGRNTDGTFAAGNPGRPRNARNLATRAMEELLDGESEAITRKCIELAKNGDLGAIRLVLERTLPVRKDRTIQVEIPSVKSLDDVATALQAVVESVGAGELTPSEGATFSGLLQNYSDALRSKTLEERLEALEAQVNPQS